jgi:hypothetical protein
MPAHIEVISPEIIAISNNDWGEIFSELTRKLHAYDEIARMALNDKNFLINKIQELQNIPVPESRPEKKAVKKVKSRKKK